MSMVRSVLFIIIATVLAACSAATPISIPTPFFDRDKTEEQTVYDTALAVLYGASKYVFMDTSATDIGGIENTSITLDFVLKNIHDVDSSTVDSFIERNDPASSIQSGMDLTAEYTLLSEYAYNQIFNQNQSGWEIFYDHYPTLSHVGFNETFDQALVYIGTQSNWLAGAGYYLLLKKMDDVWMLDQQVMVWIS